MARQKRGRRCVYVGVKHEVWDAAAGVKVEEVAVVGAAPGNSAGCAFQDAGHYASLTIGRVPNLERTHSLARIVKEELNENSNAAR